MFPVLIYCIFCWVKYSFIDVPPPPSTPSQHNLPEWRGSIELWELSKALIKISGLCLTLPLRFPLTEAGATVSINE